MSKRAARDQVEAQMAAEREALSEVTSVPTAVRTVILSHGFCVKMPVVVRFHGAINLHWVMTSERLS